MPNQKLRSLLPWISTGLILPGLNILVKKNKALGALILGAFVLLIGALAYVLITTGVEETVFNVAASGNTLRYAGIAIGVVGLIWALSILGGYFASRQGDMDNGRKVVAGVVTVLLMAVVLVPVSVGSYVTLRSGTVVDTVFGQGTDTAAPSLSIPSTGSTSGGSESGGNGTEGTSPAEEPLENFDNVERVNVMILGSDAGPGRRGVRADILLVASIDPQTGNTVLFALPRNLQRAKFPAGTPGAAEFPNGFTFEEGLINSAWLWAENNADLFPGDPLPGLTATRQLVSESLGLNIDESIVVNMAGFETIVDSFGGVVIDVPRDLPIGGVDSPIEGYVVAGQDRLLDGKEALNFIRSRSDSSDYDRMDRTQSMVKELIGQAEPLKIATSFGSLADALEGNIFTTIDSENLQPWFTLLSSVKGGELTSYAFTNEVITPSRPNFDRIHALVDEAIKAP